MTGAAPLAVVTAVPGSDWDARLVAALDDGRLGVVVVRRCVDLADLLSVAPTGVAQVAVVSPGLRRLDRDALGRLAAAGVAVVGLAPAGDENAERRLRQLGIDVVVADDAAPRVVADAVRAAHARGAPTEVGFAGSGTGSAALVPPVAAAPVEPGSGRLVAVWGPTGAPGRTSVAVGLAAELAGLDVSALLVDADVYGGAVAQVLGFLEEAPGLAAACRLANTGVLDLPKLAQLVRDAGAGLSVLPGISRPARWPELRPAAFASVLALCRSLADITVIDCGFSLEQDEELAYDTAAPRRNGATLAALGAADTVLVVGSADPVGLQRLVRGLSDLRETVPTAATPLVVVNRTRPGVFAGDIRSEVGAALQRYAGMLPTAYLPLDVAAYDAALATGRTLREAAPGAPIRRAFVEVAAVVAGRPPARRRRWAGRPQSA